jgi:anthranilate synthase component 2
MNMKIAVIDNYDSFTYNLVHYIESIIDESIDVYRNNEVEISALNEYNYILLSPGPGIPEEAGICLDLIKTYGESKNILGVCLGHQAIAEAYGGSISNLSEVYHGVSTPVKLTKIIDPLFQKLPMTFEAGRYHSWVVDKKSLPSTLSVTCEDNSGIIMGLTHNKHSVKGVQFHPESVLTEHGMQIMRNWLGRP